MSEIKFFLKFGERKHLQRLQEGNLFFSNAQTFRYYEEKLSIKGQGDRLEGSSLLAANNMTMIGNDTHKPVFTDVKGDIFIHYESANLLPVFCLFACFEKDCSLKRDGTFSIKLSDDIKENVIAHFPKADTVAIIKTPQQFIKDVYSTVGTECKSDVVNYFHLLGFNGKHGKTNNLAYFKYLAQDVPPRKENGKTVYSFNDKYVYRSLLCKDIFFKKEQEYRFILTQRSITKAQEFHVKINECVELQDLDYFFSH